MVLKIITLCIFLMSQVIIVRADDLYRSAMKSYIGAWPSVMAGMDVNTFIRSLDQINKQMLVGFDEAKMSEYAKKYREEQLEDDLIDYILRPAFKEKVTIEDLHVLIGMMQNPEGKQYQEHSVALSRKMKTPKAQQKIASFIKTTFSYVKINEAPIDYYSEAPLPEITIRKNVTVKKIGSNKGKNITLTKVSGYDEEYKSLFYECYDTSAVSILLKPMEKMLAQTSSGLNEKQLGIAMQHIKKNMPSIVFDMAYDILTKQDLQLEIRYHKTDVYKHVLAAMESMSDHLSESAQNWVASYVNWLKKQDNVSERLLQTAVDATNAQFLNQDGDEIYNIKLNEAYYIFEITLKDNNLFGNLKEEYRTHGRDCILNEFKYCYPSSFNESLLSLISNTHRGYMIRYVSNSNNGSFKISLSNSEVDNIYKNLRPLLLAQEGKKHYDANEYGPALPLLKKAGEENDPMSQYLLGTMYDLGNGVAEDDIEALKWYGMAAKQDVNTETKTLSTRGMALIYASLGQEEKSMAYADEVIKLQPEAPSSYDTKGVVLSLLGKKKEAKAMWKKVLSLAPNYDKDTSLLYMILFGK